MQDIERDIETEHQQQLTKLNAEVGELRRLLRQSQRMASVGTMTAMIAHEFNNILTPIINYAQMAQNNPALVDKAIKRAADGGLRASEICSAILRMTRKAPAEFEAVSLHEAVGETIVAMARDFQKDRIELEIDIPANLSIATRKIELQQVLLNLLINARAAVMDKQEPRRIRIRAIEDTGTVTISVSDTGSGIAPENLERIFDPYFTTKHGDEDQEPGHGLGLAICREIIESLGGNISVESEPDRGAAFTINLARC